MKIHFLVLYSVLTFAGAASAQDYSNENTNGGVDHVNIELGLAAGTTGPHSYTEYNLAVNTFFTPQLAWRNSFFTRKEAEQESSLGLETGLRGSVGFRKQRSGFALFAGPGFRFMTHAKVSPLLELGILFKQGGLSIGGGVKTIAKSVFTAGAEDDILFFIFLAGGETL